MTGDEYTGEDDRVLIEGLNERAPPQDGFFAQIGGGFRLVDAVVIVLPVVVLGGVFQLSVETRRALAFDPLAPSPLTAFTANYVHLELSHLFASISGYLVLVSVIYLLALANRGRRRFYTALGTILIVLPVLLSMLNLAITLSGIMVGFSGLNMALLGYGLVELSVYTENYITKHVGVENAPGLFFPVISVIAWRFTDSTGLLSIFAVSALLSVLYWMEVLPVSTQFTEGLRDLFARHGYFELFIGAAVIFAGFAFISFPHTPVVQSGIVNVYTHFTGFCLGFIVVYTWEILT